jgi:hypothetical protein
MVLCSLLTGGCGSRILFPVIICITGTVCSIRRGGFAEGAVITCIVIGEKMESPSDYTEALILYNAQGFRILE